VIIDISKKKNRTKAHYAIALVQDECVIAESNYRKTNDFNAYKDAIKRIEKYTEEFLIK